jgi:hypothetical protein
MIPDGIQFSTDRDADLLLEFDWADLDGSTGWLNVSFDAKPIGESHSLQHRFLLPSVKAGEHAVTVTARALCNDSPQVPSANRAVVNTMLRSLVVQYLE